MLPPERLRRNEFWRSVVLWCALIAPFAGPEWSAAADGDEAMLRDYHSGNGLLTRGLHEMAATEYRKFLTEHGDHAKASSARYGLAVCFYKLGQLDEAVSLLTPLSKLPKFEFAADTLMLLGQCRLGEQEYAAAARAFEMLVSRHPSHKLADSAAALVVESNYRSGTLQAVETAYAEFVKRSPKSALRERVEFFSGLALMGLGDYGKAAGRFAASVAQFGEGVLAGQARLLAAQCDHRAGIRGPARKYYKAVIKEADRGRLPDALLGLGALCQEQGRYAEAKAHFTQLLDGFEDHAGRSDARLRLGQCCIELGDLEQAGRVLREIPAESGQADEAAYWLAKASFKLEHHAKAADILSKAIREHRDSPLLPEMTYDLGVARLRGGDQAGAIAAFGRHLAKFPKHELAPEALYLVALIEHQLKDYDQSQAHCKAFAANYPDHERISRVVFLLGENEYLSGKHEAAAKMFAKFLQRFAADAQALQARFRLGMALYHLEQYDQAREILAEVEGLAEGDGALHSVLLALGDLHFRDGNWPEAERLLGKYL